jgi:hypothetical protein
MGAPRGNRNAWKHGRSSRESRALRAHARSLIREINTILGKAPRRPSRRRPRGSSPVHGGLRAACCRPKVTAQRAVTEGAIAGSVGHITGPSVSSPPIRRDSEP